MSPEIAIPATAVEPAEDRPWYKTLTRTQWNVFWATFLGWTVDAFDFHILAFILLDIQQSFTVDRALAGLLGTVTLATRLIGATAAGTMADKYGRKLPLILSILWFSLFACLSGFSTSYAMLFAFRALFGIGMGGEYAAGMPLVLEHWPARHRGLVSGMLQGGFYWGYVLAAAAFQFVYPLFRAYPDSAWRAMFWMALLPALMTLWIRRSVPESPVWLERQRLLRERAASGVPPEPSVSLVRLFRPDLILVTMHASLVVTVFICLFHSIAFWYPTLLREAGRPPFGYLVMFNAGAIVGAIAWGRISETKIGRRGAMTLGVLTAIGAVPLYVSVASAVWLAVGAVTMGFFGAGAWGIVPAYLSERFPTSVRGVGPGFTYHAGAAVGSIAPVMLGVMQDRGIDLSRAMSIAITAAAVLIVLMVWTGPETRGRHFTLD